jgi:hypothetical protein
MKMKSKKEIFFCVGNNGKFPTGSYYVNRKEIIIYMTPMIKFKEKYGDDAFNQYFADVISHEYLHKILHEHFGIEISGQMDNIAGKGELMIGAGV